MTWNSRTPRSSQESEDLTLGLSAPDGEPSASPRSTPTPAPSSPSDGPESRTSVTSLLSSRRGQRASGDRTHDADTECGPNGGERSGDHVPDATLWSGGFPCQDLTVAGKRRGMGTDGRADTRPASPTPSLTLWSATDLPPSSSRMYRDSSPVMAAATLGRSSVAWANSGTGGPTGFSTLSSSECPSADDGCSFSPSTLSQVLEPTAPQRFYLSARAATGILRRATRRGTELPRPCSSIGALPAQPVHGLRDRRPRVHAGHFRSSVRRLTPVECERLMGWPDGWTIVHEWPQRSTRTRAAAGDTTPTRPRTSSPTASRRGSAHQTATSDGSRTDLPIPSTPSSPPEYEPLTQLFSEMIEAMPLEKLEDWEAMEPEAFSPSASTPTDTDAAATE